MYNNVRDLMISGCFISVLCITMEQRHSQIKLEGTDKQVQQNIEYVSFMVGNIKQLFLP